MHNNREIKKTSGENNDLSFPKSLPTFLSHKFQFFHQLYIQTHYCLLQLETSLPQAARSSHNHVYFARYLLLLRTCFNDGLGCLSLFFLDIKNMYERLRYEGMLKVKRTLPFDGLCK